MKGYRDQRLCAFCGTRHIVYLKRHLNYRDLFVASFLSVILTWVIWQSLAPTGSIFFFAFIAFAEIFVQMRHRLSLICRECGFDPVLYLRDRERCVEKVKQTLSLRRQTPSALLKPLALPYRPQNHLPVPVKPINLSNSLDR